MKLKKSFAWMVIMAMLVLSACTTDPQETGGTTEPHETTQIVETTVPPETTVPIETTQPVETTQPIVMDPEQSMSFFAFHADPAMFYYDFYIAPAGTEDWYLVHVSSEYCDHHPGEGYGPDETIRIRQAWIDYTGPEVEQWVMRCELYVTEEIEALYGEQESEYIENKWTVPFEIDEDETVVCLGNELGYPGEVDAPTIREMERCDKCPADWRIDD